MWQLKTLEKKGVDRIKIGFGIFALALLLSASFLFLYYLYLPPKVLADDAAASVNLTSSVSVSFNKPVDRNSLSYQISPNINGKLSFEDNLYKSHLFTKVVFTPDRSFLPNTDYSLKLTEISSIYNKKNPKEYNFNFKSKDVPRISHYSIENNAQNISPATTLEAFLNQPKSDIIDYTFTLDPTVDLKTTFDSSNNKYLLSPATPLIQDTSYVLTATSNLDADNDKTKLQDEKLSFKTAKAPDIQNYTPTGNNVSASTSEIKITFSTKMDQADVLKNISISPNAAGSWHWDTDMELVYSFSDKLQYDADYLIVLKRETKDNSGGYLTFDFSYSFSTIGRVSASSFTPKNGATGILTNTSISISFNQPVDHASAESLFSVSPTTAGTFSWQNNKMIFKPASPLAKDAVYTATLASDVKSLGGLDSNRKFESVFHTEMSSVLLNVPMDYQDKALSCEAASLKMALNYKGANVSENDIMNIIGFDPTIHEGNTWGDPNIAFVGDINGKQNTTGYGVYWGPIARAANSWRISEAFSGWSPQQLAKAVSDGNPVVIWGVYGSGYLDPWTTPDGRRIDAWKGEHARTVIGFNGPIDNPTEFVINDPYAGRVTWSTEKLLADWGKFGNSGVVVY